MTAIGKGQRRKTAVPKITADDRRRGEKISQARKALGESQQKFGARFGVEQVTVSRWEQGFPVEQKHWMKLAGLLKENPAIFLRNGSKSDVQLDMSGSTQFFEVKPVVKVGIAEAGVWRDVEIDPPISRRIVGSFDPDSTEREEYPIIGSSPDQRWRDMRQFAVLVSGSSMDRVIPPGYWAVCVPYWEARQTIQDGDLVLVERRRAGTYQATIKRVARNGKGWELRPESTDPKFKEPIHLADDQAHKADDSDTEVEIVGLVVCVSRPVV